MEHNFAWRHVYKPGMALLGLDEVRGDPNSTRRHVDVIKEALQKRANDPNACAEDREQARQMLTAYRPETKPADPLRYETDY